jgi:hypothetical protein
VVAIEVLFAGLIFFIKSRINNKTLFTVIICLLAVIFVTVFEAQKKSTRSEKIKKVKKKRMEKIREAHDKTN